MIKNGKQKRQGNPCLFCVDWSDSAEIAANSAENAGRSAKRAEHFVRQVWYNTGVATGECSQIRTAPSAAKEADSHEDPIDSIVVR